MSRYGLYLFSLIVTLLVIGVCGNDEAVASGSYYIVGLDRAGDNWLALRSQPSFTTGTRLLKMGPETLLTCLGRQGEWLRLRTNAGEVGWAIAKYIACCRKSDSRVVQAASSVKSIDIARAFRAQAAFADRMCLEEPIVTSGWALQGWGDENTGGAALLRLDAVKGWIVVDSGGGGWDLRSLLSHGVPKTAAKQLLASER